MSKRGTSRKPPGPWGPRWSRWVGRFLARGLWRTEVRDADKVPRTGGAVLVANHLGFIDGPIVHGVVRRGSHMLITKRMYKGPLRLLFSTAGMIEVDETGREALARALAVLRRGGLVGVFPEGTRGAGGAESTQGGAAWLSIHANVPVIPVAIFGTRHTGESVNIWPKPRRRLLAAFGDPFMPKRPDGLKGAALISHARDEIENVLQEHVQAVAATTDIELPVDDPIRDREREGTA